MQCLEVFNVLIILSSICWLINAKCVENEKDTNNLECTSDNLIEVNNQRDKVNNFEFITNISYLKRETEFFRQFYLNFSEL